MQRYSEFDKCVAHATPLHKSLSDRLANARRMESAPVSSIPKMAKGSGAIALLLATRQ